MINEAKMTELTQAEDMAYFRADLSFFSPESYSLDEKKDLQRHDEREQGRARRCHARGLRAVAPPPDARAKLLDMLCASGVESPQWWWDVLVGDGGPLYRELEPLS